MVASGVETLGAFLSCGIIQSTVVSAEGRESSYQNHKKTQMEGKNCENTEQEIDGGSSDSDDSGWQPIVVFFGVVAVWCGQSAAGVAAEMGDRIGIVWRSGDIQSGCSICFF